MSCKHKTWNNNCRELSDANLPLTMECTFDTQNVNPEQEIQFDGQQADIVDYKIDSREIEENADGQQIESVIIDYPTLDPDPIAAGQSNSLSAHLILILSMILVMQAILSHI